MRVSGVNSELQSMLAGTGVECVLLPNHSPELNPIELALNVMT